MRTTALSILKLAITAFGTVVIFTSLVGCGDLSDKDAQRLGLLIDQFDAANQEGSRQLASGEAKSGYSFLLSMYEKQLELVKEHRSDNSYGGEIKEQLDTLEEGLNEGVRVYQKWVDAGYTSENPAPDELSIVNGFAMKLTQAEIALTILAGK